MKRLLILSAMIAVISVPAQATAATIFASEVLSFSGSFSQSPTASTSLTKAGLAAVVADDIGTFVMSNDKVASIDLGFGDNKVVSGAGADLVIYTVGNGYKFGLQVLGKNNRILSNFIYSVPVDGSSTAKDENGDSLCVIRSENCVAAISATAINLPGIADNTKIDKIRLFIGNDYNGDVNGEAAYPLFSLATALHTATFTTIDSTPLPITAVPLPLSAVLFSSGLALLGWTGRKKRA